MRPLNAASKNAAPVPVASSTAETQLFAAKENTLGRLICNDSTALLHVKFGPGASLTDKNVIIAAGATYELPNYVGVVTGVWAAANGFAYCTELG